MNELEEYHDHGGGRELVNLQIPPEPGNEATSDLVAGILRRWYIVFLVFLVLCGAGLSAVWCCIRPVYHATGAIWVKADEQNIVTGDSEGELSNYEGFMNTQAEKITSSSVVQRVADALVDKDLSFFKDKPPGLLSKLEKWLGIARTKLEPARRLKDAILDESIMVAADGQSELIKVTMIDPNEEEAKQIVDAFITAYMEIEVVRSLEDENQQLKLLEAQRDVLSLQMDSDRQTMYQMGQEFGSVALGSREAMQLERIGDLYTMLTTVQAERIELEAQVKLLERTGGQPIPPAELLQIRQDQINADPAVLALMPTISLLEQELIVAKQTLQPMHPQLRSKAENLEAFKARLEELKQEAGQAFDERASEEAADAGRTQLVVLRNDLEQ